MNLSVGRKVEKKLGGANYNLKRFTPFLVSVSDGDKQWLESIDGDVSVEFGLRFPELPYYLRFKAPLTSAPNTLLKSFIRLPLVKALILSSTKREIIVARSFLNERKAWFGEVYDGVLCDNVDAELSVEPAKGEFANLPIRFSNKYEEALTLKKFLLKPKYMTLYEGETGFFTNKVYVDITGEDEVKVSYTKSTTSRAGKTKVLVAQKEKPEKGIHLSFAPTILAKQFGL